MRVLAVVAHPDDETLGAGATLAHHVAAGDTVGVVALTDGVGARSRLADVEAQARRQKAAEVAGKEIGFEWVAVHDLPDNQLDTVGLLDVVRLIEEHIDERRPALIYTHHWGDLNVDHRACHEAVVTAARPQPGASVKEIRAMEVPSATGWRGSRPDAIFTPDTWIDVSSTWDRKAAALAAYSEELRPEPHVRSRAAIDALAVARGSEIGVSRAECFVTVRRLIG